MLLTLILATIAPSQGPSDNPAVNRLVEAIRKPNKSIAREVLANGLEVYIVPVEKASTVTTMLVYRVGSADEKLDQTGLSHYLEHLMFKGTAKLMPGDIDRVTLRNGGANNAFTSEDITAYHFDFSADRWEEALKIEADRMRNLVIDDKHEFEQEKGAVIEELNRGEDEPWDLESKALLPHLFGKTGPYGHPVIGEKSHVRAATAAIIKAHHDRWYHPNNAVLVVAGGIETATALGLVRKHLGAIPKAVLPERPSPPRELPKLPVRQEMPSKFDVVRLALAYRTVPAGHPDEAPIDFLSILLAEGRTSRLHTRLVEEDGLASEISSAHTAGRHPGWMQVDVELLPDSDIKETEQALFEEIDSLRDKAPTMAETERVRRKILASLVFEQSTVHGRAQGVAIGVMQGGMARLDAYIDSVARVTPADLLRAAKTYLADDRRAMIVSKPGMAAAFQAAPGARRAKSAKARALAGSSPQANPLDGARRIVLPNGIVALLLERKGLPVIAAEARWRELRRHEPGSKAGLAMLTSYLLEEGSDGRTGIQFASDIEDMGASISFDLNRASLTALSQDKAKALGLMFAALDRPDFPEDAFEQMRDGQLATILNNEKDGTTRARQALHGAVYGRTHYLGRPAFGERKSVEKLERDDCVDFHRRVMTPDNLVVAVVGDFDAMEMEKLLVELAGKAKARKAPPLPALPPIPAPRSSREYISIPGSAQLQFFMGHAGITRDHPDYHTLLVMDHVLGTGPGFTDRLSARLRDREGLAYTVRAEICSSADLLPGVFACYIGTDASNLERVEKEFREEIDRLRKEQASAQEVADAKSYLLGNLPFKYDGHSALADQLQAYERFGWKSGHLDSFRKAVSEVTPAMVLEAAKKHINPEKFHLVAAGAIDKKTGKPLK